MYDIKIQFSSVEDRRIDIFKNEKETMFILLIFKIDFKNRFLSWHHKLLIIREKRKQTCNQYPVYDDRRQTSTQY